MNLMERNDFKWLRILLRINGLNRKLKEPGWIFSDKDKAYELKDMIIQKLLNEKPAEVDIKLYYIPYILYSNESKDKAGNLMRGDAERYPFEYYLAQVEPSPYDREVPEKANVEVVASCLGELFSFHMPINKVEECGYDTSKLERKRWVNASNYNHEMLENIEKEISEIIASL